MCELLLGTRVLVKLGRTGMRLAVSRGSHATGPVWRWVVVSQRRGSGYLSLSLVCVASIGNVTGLSVIAIIDRVLLLVSHNGGHACQTRLPRVEASILHEPLGWRVGFPGVGAVREWDVARKGFRRIVEGVVLHMVSSLAGTVGRYNKT